MIKTIFVLSSLLLFSVNATATQKFEMAPVFDFEDEIHAPSGADITPEPPQLTRLDQKILKICGKLGAKVRKEEFLELLNSSVQGGSLLSRLQSDLERSGIAVSAKSFRHDLVEIWTRRHGFKHIFCGEMSARGLSGLHYAPRYHQLSEQGLIGIATSHLKQCRPEVEDGTVYTIPVSYVNKRGNMKMKCRSGYGYQLDAYTLLLEGSRAFLSSHARFNGKRKYVCRHSILDKSESGRYWTALVVQNESIRTFFTIKRNKRTKHNFSKGCNAESDRDDQY